METKPKADHVTISFTDEYGEDGLLRVALRGADLRATLVAGDGATVERLSTEIADIRRTLLERGFQEVHVAVQGIRRGAEGDVATATRGWDDRPTWSEQQRESSREQQQHRESSRRHRDGRDASGDGHGQEGRDQ